MAGMFSGIDQSVKVEVEEEKLGGGGYVKDTGVYNFIIEMAYGGQSAGGAYFLDLKLKTEDGQRMNVREYITSGDAKGIRPYYIDKDGKQRALPGYAKMNALDVLLTGNTEQYPSTESKTIPLWNKDAEKEVPTEANVVTEWIGKPITALVRCLREFKQVKNETTGKWVNSTETKESGEILHFVDPITGQTRSEKLAGKDAAVKPSFETKYNSDYVMDKTKGKGGKPAAAATPAAPAASPFGNK